MNEPFKNISQNVIKNCLICFFSGGEVTGEYERVMFRDTDETTSAEQKPPSMFEALFERTTFEDEVKRRQSAPSRVVSERAKVRIDVPINRKVSENKKHEPIIALKINQKNLPSKI